MTRISIGSRLVLVLATILATAPAMAQDMPEMTPEQMAEMQAYMKAGTPGAEHRALASTTGTYDLVIKSWHEPGGPAMESRGTATRTMELDGRVMVEKVSAAMMGMPYTGRGMTGFDNVTGTYWSTWMDSMSTGLMVSEGTCDDSHVCTYVGSWNDPIKKGPIEARMVIRPVDEKTSVFEMFAPGRDGKEMKMMEITYIKR